MRENATYGSHAARGRKILCRSVGRSVIQSVGRVGRSFGRSVGLLLVLLVRKIERLSVRGFVYLCVCFVLFRNVVP